jgi:MFS family permease
MGGEWSLGVALVNEIWPGKSRALVAGLIGAAANVGFLMVAVLSMGLVGFIDGMNSFLRGIGFSEGLADYLLRNSAWRFLMISGAFPAVLIFLIRLFVPESEKWQAEHKRGATSYWLKADLIGVLIGCIAALGIIWAWSPAGFTTLGRIFPGSGFAWFAAAIITVVGLVVALLSFLYPVRQYLLRAIEANSLKQTDGRRVLRMMLFGAALAGVALLGTWGSTQWAPRWVADELLRDPGLRAQHPLGKEWTQVWSALGAIAGTMVAALCAGRFGRKITYAVLCAGSILAALHLYQFNHHYDTRFLISVFLLGALTASFYGFFPLYLPELFPTAVRATGQGFAYNFGRILAAIGGLQTANLMAAFEGSFAKAGSVLTAIYVIGLVIIWFGPETKGKPLPE